MEFLNFCILPFRCRLCRHISPANLLHFLWSFSSFVVVVVAPNYQRALTTIYSAIISDYRVLTTLKVRRVCANTHTRERENELEWIKFNYRLCANITTTMRIEMQPHGTRTHEHTAHASVTIGHGTARDDCAPAPPSSSHFAVSLTILLKIHSRM